MKYKITIAEGITYRQFVGYVDAENKNEAIEKAKEQFIIEHPIYNGKFRVIMCNKVQAY